MKRIRPERSQTVEVGSVFGRLTALSQVLPNHRGQAVWRCRCDCGTEKDIRASSLKGGIASSCGCLYREVRPIIRLTHGDKPKVRKVPAEYTAWTNMMTRCTNPKHNRWHRYGGRGIKVCDRWLNSYEDFLADVGRRPGPDYSLDRYPNADGDYEPGNVRWATDGEQARNKSKAA